MSILEVLESTGLDTKYGVNRNPTTDPYLVYTGGGQENFTADDTFYHSEDGWVIEYYFKVKNPTTEKLLENTLLNNGYLYEKSEDTYLEDQELFLIYYYI